MEKRKLKGIAEEISLLGFGLMRLPLKSQEAADIDMETGQRMVDMAIESGVNYFDTAWVYHGGESETFAGKALSKHPRDSFRLATKMPPWVLNSKDELERIFSEQLRKCRVDYFDFYLIHNIGADSFDAMLKYDVYEFLSKKKDAGYIKYLGFSAHDAPSHIEKIVNGWKWDFGQIQLNYLDWDDIDAKRLYEILSGRGIPAVVMEPVRGGALADLGPEGNGILRASDASASPASWAMRYAASLPGVLTVLSGMSNVAQVEDNIKTIKNFRPLADNERAVLADAAKAFRKAGGVPCTGCRYCMDCPAGVDIPRAFGLYNHYRKALVSNPAMAGIVFKNAYRTLDEREMADKCVSCGKCVPLCPQGINIPELLKEVAESYAKLG